MKWTGVHLFDILAANGRIPPEWWPKTVEFTQALACGVDSHREERLAMNDSVDPEGPFCLPAGLAFVLL
jgi:hypothetical protein